MTAPPRLFDRTLHRRRLDRAASRFAAADFLKARAAGDAVERLEAILREFPLCVDLGARNGAFARALADSDAITIIDYKFGHWHSSYPDQVREYKELVQKMEKNTRRFFSPAMFF